MKSYFLEHISSVDIAKKALSARLPGQSEPWLLVSPLGDPIAYFNVYSALDGAPVPNVQADMSGRHYDEADAVTSVLKDVQAVAGGIITDDA